MKSVVCGFVVIYMIFISQGMPTLNIETKEEIKHIVTNLKQVSSDIDQEIRNTYRVYSKEHEQRIQARKYQSAKDSFKLKSDRLIQLQDKFNEYSDDVFQRMRASLLDKCRNAQAKVNELISFLQKVGCTKVQWQEIEIINQKILNDVSTMEQLMNTIDHQCHVINKISAQVGQLEDQTNENNSPRAKETLKNLYSNLQKNMEEWQRDDLAHGIHIVSIVDKFAYAIPEKVTEIMALSQ